MTGDALRELLTDPGKLKEGLGGGAGFFDCSLVQVVTCVLGSRALNDVGPSDQGRGFRVGGRGSGS